MYRIKFLGDPRHGENAIVKNLDPTFEALVGKSFNWLDAAIDPTTSTLIRVRYSIQILAGEMVKDFTGAVIYLFDSNQQEYYKIQHDKAKFKKAKNQCPECGSYRADGFKPYIHRDGCSEGPVISETLWNPDYYPVIVENRPPDVK